MHLRKYCPEDCDEIMELFKNTVHHVNARNYTPEQLDAWAPDKLNREQWNRSLSEHNTVVAVQNNTIVGFGDIDSTGYLDRLFVHYLHQREGIATAICDLLEQSYKGSITTDASITAKQFFENRGYRVIRQQTVVRNGISLKNFVMEYDLAVLNSTGLPAIAHDSLLFGDLGFKLVEGIMKLYEQNEKQIFISFDKQGAHTPVTQRILEKHAVLRLSDGTRKLYGQSWDTETEEKP